MCALLKSDLDESDRELLPTAYAEAATGCWAGRMAYVHVRHVFSHECRVMCCHVILNRNMRPRNESGKRYMRQVGLQEAAFPLP